ncbi:hypothetical protein [Curtobacterium sp. MCSS17_016]|uniref:hypothetical protein n=1 Tax=Curtobacterium sp. MCSS17_016 TaxID=2175644 RepID=UPI000DA8945F|nr:hypothetical protein [Curtobacterium sp. MCSS17_016]WIE81500.1 hypothetical protein DEJ19_019885 [Curtobacterium sp. MCSS17_016]
MTDNDDVMTRQDVLRRVPLANRPTVSSILDHIAVSAFHPTDLYVRADRTDGQPPLRIASGWVNGFTDRDEAVAAGGSRLEVWPSRERAPLWGLWMPENSRRDGGSNGPRRAEQQPCPTCGELMPLTNVCDVCG